MNPPASRPDLPAAKTLLAGAAWLALTGPLFFLVYGWCNTITAGRPHVAAFFFSWERRIPFVPVMIIPYLSIDLFFAGSFFLCRDRVQLRTHVARIILAIAVSAVAFLLIPLRYGWTRPAVGGWLGMLFEPLNALDQPYNLCPSLHISLRTLVWCVYGACLRDRRWLRGALWSWFALIGLSTLLIYQHHVVDLAGGYLVAVLCCRIFPDSTPDRSPIGGPVQPLAIMFSKLLPAGVTTLFHLLAGTSVRWVGCRPDTRQRVYFANHGSHLDTLALWTALPSAARPLTRPVAARDYWMANKWRRYLARAVFRAVLIDRGQAAAVRADPIEPLLSALANGRNSLILFPEGSRGRSADVGPFKSGLYYLAKRRPDIELVPALIGYFGRVLPAGWPLPDTLSFGTPLRLEPGEEKFAFLARARAAVAGLRTA